MSDRLRKHYSQSLLGRLRLKLLEGIGKGADLPSAGEIRLHLVKLYREHPLVAELQRHILDQDVCSVVRFADLSKNPNWPEILRSLEDHPLPTTFVQLEGCPKPWPDLVGVMIERETISPSGYAYPVTAIREDSFPTSFAGRIEIRACREAPQPELAALSSKGWARGLLRNSPLGSVPGMLARVIAAVVRKRARRKPVVNLRPHPLAPEGPHDRELDRRLLLVSKGTLRCTKARIPLADVNPFSLDFCLSHPLDLVEQEAGNIKQAPESGAELLVYWNGTSFICSDDYISFLAYRTNRAQAVPVVILGEFPPNRARELGTGGPELIPPARAARLPDVDNEEVKQITLDHRLRRHLDAPSDAVATLYAIHIILSKMIASHATTERDLHRLLERHPIVLAPHGIRMLSEVALGRDYRIDLVIQSDLAAKRLQFIELEASKKKIFTKQGRPRAEVTHAIQQVEDWIRWWREHPKDVPAHLDGSIDPDGMVVIGRDHEMSADDRRRLASLNGGRRVQVFTYDDLLRQLEAMLEHLEQTVEEGEGLSKASKVRARRTTSN